MKITNSSASLLISVLFLLFPLIQTEAGTSKESGESVTFVCTELLGRPTQNSISINLCTGQNAEVYIEYGTQPAVYTSQTAVYSLSGNIPQTLLISSLSKDTKYFYRVRYRPTGSGDFLTRDEHSFQTARSARTSFVFSIEADPHLDEATNPDLFRQTLTNIQESKPDFLLDLGDTFMSEKLADPSEQEIKSRHLLLRSFFDAVCHSMPLMLAIGNHEGELGWLLNGTQENTAVRAANIRKQYFPNPVPDGFYSGDITPENFVDLRQNYYSWTWGNSLFIVLDPYWYTNKKPGSSKNNWDWTLGKTQYDWFKQVLETSKADFKFVFAHQIVGGTDTEGRGGIEGVPFFEMGGLNPDGTSGFEVNRPGWEKPLHQLMVDNKVSAFFHGHDHLFVKEDLDGIVYLEVPQPAYYNYKNPEKSYSNTSMAAGYGYTHGTIISSSGFVKVSVSDSVATVDYIRSYLPEHENSERHNGETGFSFTIRKPGIPSQIQDQKTFESGFYLDQNYPNPFNPETTIRFFLKESGFVTLKIYDGLGREVAVPVNEFLGAGQHAIQFNGSGFASGTYLYRITSPSFSGSRVMVLVK